MKQTNVKVLALVAALVVGNVAYGYTFDFTNTLKGPVSVRVKLSGIDEPWYQRTLQGKNERKGRSYGFSFRVNNQEPSVGVKGDQAPTLEWTGRKLGFCLSQIQVAPWEWNAAAGRFEETDEWYDMSPTFIETNYFNKMLQAASGVAEGSVSIAGRVVEEIAQSLAGDPGVKKAVEDKLKEEGEKPTPEKVSQRISAAKEDIGGLVEAIGKVVSTSLCKDRSFTILPNIDKKGNVVSGYYLITNER